MLKRLGWGVGDQALSSLTNLLVGLAAARALNPQGFGSWAIAFTVSLLALGISRAMTAEPYVVRHTDAEPSERRRSVSMVTGSALAIGLAVSVAGALGAAISAVFIDVELGLALAALAVCAPGLLLQDAQRFIFFAERRGRAAFANDAVWAGLLLLVLSAFEVIQTSVAGAYVLAWGGTGTVAGVLATVQNDTRPSLRSTRAWLSRHRDMIPRFVAEFGIARGLGQVGVFVLAGVSGIAAAGAFRAAELVLGPISVLIQTMGLAAISEGVRSLSDRPAVGLYRSTMVLGGVLVLVTVGWGAIALSIPDGVGRFLLGASWEGGRSILLPRTLAIAAAGASAAAVVGLRATARADLSIRVRSVVSVLLLLALSIGAVVEGVVGAAWGLAIAGWAGVPIWWWNWRAAARLKDEAG